MVDKVIFTILFLLIATFVNIISPNIVSSQTCPQYVTIDSYKCGDPNLLEETCEKPTYRGDNWDVTCGLNNGSCVSTIGWCSSNDDCVYQEDEFRSWCQCTDSVVQCNLAGGGTPPPGGGCGTTAPSFTAINWGSSTVSINWNNGTGGQNHSLVASSNQAAILGSNPCTGIYAGQCVISATNVTSPYVTSRTPSFTVGTTYHFRIINVAGVCSKDDTTSSTAPAICSLTVPTWGTITKYNNTRATLNWNLGSGGASQRIYMDDVQANLNDNCATSVCNVEATGISPSTETYTTIGGSLSPGTTYYAKVINYQSASCNAPSDVKSYFHPSIIVQSAWWQVVDGDITTNENINSDVPSGELLIENGVGGFPGVPVYGTSLNTGSGTTSSKNWNSDTTTTLPRTFNYSYFESLIPEDVTSGETYNGYEWYIISGDTTINFTNFADRKVIYFIDGDLTINGNLRVNDGVGFAGFFVSGDINIATNVRNLEGIYLSDGDFNTGVNTLDLKVRGSVTALEDFNLDRSLSDNLLPAEIFTFAPDQILLFPKDLMFRRVKWAEVAP